LSRGSSPSRRKAEGEGSASAVDVSVIRDIDHVGIAVTDLDAAVREYRAVLGTEPVHREVVEDQGVEEVLFRAGTSYIQLVAALGPDTPVGKFLDKRGEGLHHVGYRVDDVATVLERLRASGIPLVDEKPRRGSRGTTVAFVHPRGFRGVLVELVQEGPLTRTG
jgi:methylmalonyl-CoA/ethylmalonyl-CoA epimerase